MLATRVASAAVFGPLLILAGYLGGPLLWAIVAFIVVWGLLEMDRLLRPLGLRAWPALTVPAGLGLAALAAAGRWPYSPALLTLTALAAMFVPALAPARAKGLDAVGSIFAVVYVPWLASHFVLLRELPEGLALFFVALVGTWAFDSGSYFAGKAFGRHKLSPKVSPGKSVEGLIGGIVLGGIVIPWLGLAWLGLEPLEAAALAAAVMAAAQLGDLAESALKRQSGVKDSGTLIPGHGGILDRFDSLLAVMPVVYYIWVLWLGA